MLRCGCTSSASVRADPNAVEVEEFDAVRPPEVARRSSPRCDQLAQLPGSAKRKCTTRMRQDEVDFEEHAPSGQIARAANCAVTAHFLHRSMATRSVMRRSWGWSGVLAPLFGQLRDVRAGDMDGSGTRPERRCVGLWNSTHVGGRDGHGQRICRRCAATRQTQRSGTGCIRWILYGACSKGSLNLDPARSTT